MHMVHPGPPQVPDPGLRGFTTPLNVSLPGTNAVRIRYLDRRDGHGQPLDEFALAPLPIPKVRRTHTGGKAQVPHAQCT